MKIVTYARVSTIAQETEGQSLPNQERAFAKWIDRGGHVRVRAYRESASAGTIEGRVEFTKMLDELAKTKPDAIVIDTLDRFSRNIEDAALVIGRLRGVHVGLMPLDWRRDSPIRMDDDRDYEDMWREILAADVERRRIARRVRRSYEGRRERGATLANKPAFGLVKRGDVLEPDPARADLVREMDRRAIAGERFTDIARWLSTMDEKATKNTISVARLLSNRAFVDAGLRTEAHQEMLDAVVTVGRKRFGFRSKHEHEFAGVFACGLCVDQGLDPAAALLAGGGATTAGAVRLQCGRAKSGVAAPPHVPFQVVEDRLRPAWLAYIDRILADEPDFEAWAREELPQAAEHRRALERQIARLDQREAALRTRRNRAMTLVGDPDAALDRQGRTILRDVDDDELAIRIQRETLADDMRALEAKPRDAATLRAALENFRDVYDDEETSTSDRNLLARLLCEAVGHPIVRRAGRSRWKDPSVEWPGAGALLSAPRKNERAPAKPEPVRPPRNDEKIVSRRR